MPRITRWCILRICFQILVFLVMCSNFCLFHSGAHDFFKIIIKYTEYTINHLNHFCVHFSGIKYIHSVVQPSPLLETFFLRDFFSSSQTEVLYPLNNKSPSPLSHSLAPGNLQSIFCLNEFAYSRDFI